MQIPRLAPLARDDRGALRLMALGIERHEIWWQFAKSAAWAPFRADAEGAAMLRKLGFA